MTKAFVLTSALLIGGAAFGLSGEMALAAEAKSTDAAKADAAKKDRCERDATLLLYLGEQRNKFIRECLASKGPPPGKAEARRPSLVHPAGPAMPRVTPLGGAKPPGTSTGGTVISNAPIAPSAPVVGSSGISTTGSRATSISGSSGTSIGSSNPGR
jgi:hypothetical protein